MSDPVTYFVFTASNTWHFILLGYWHWVTDESVHAAIYQVNYKSETMPSHTSFILILIQRLGCVTMFSDTKLLASVVFFPFDNHFFLFV